MSQLTIKKNPDSFISPFDSWLDYGSLKYRTYVKRVQAQTYKTISNEPFLRLKELIKVYEIKDKELLKMFLNSQISSEIFFRIAKVITRRFFKKAKLVLSIHKDPEPTINDTILVQIRSFDDYSAEDLAKVDKLDWLFELLQQRIPHKVPLNFLINLEYL